VEKKCLHTLLALFLGGNYQKRFEKGMSKRKESTHCLFFLIYLLLIYRCRSAMA